MQSKAKTAEEYIASLPADRIGPMTKMREVILANLPDGFEEYMCYGMIGYVVPLSTYPRGYHVTPGQPLMMVNLASQKNYIALYHMGLYADQQVLLKWFTAEYPKHSRQKLDMGKACIRFKKPDQIPFDLIGELMRKITVKEYIRRYEEARGRAV